MKKTLSHKDTHLERGVSFKMPWGPPRDPKATFKNCCSMIQRQLGGEEVTAGLVINLTFHIPEDKAKAQLKPKYFGDYSLSTDT